MVNFLKETEQELSINQKTWDDVAFIGSRIGHYGCTVEEFQKIANFTYDNGFGTAEIPSDLVILFKDNTWFERTEYDGSEDWAYREPPKVPEIYIKATQFKQSWRGSSYTDTIDE